MYERLLSVNNIPVSNLHTCAAATANTDTDSSSGGRKLIVVDHKADHKNDHKNDHTDTENIQKQRNKIAYGQAHFNNRVNNTTTALKPERELVETERAEHNLHTTTINTPHTSKQNTQQTTIGHTRTLTSASTHKPLDCVTDTAYNVVLTTSYMMLIPRSHKQTESGITVNSFGE